MTAHVVYPVWDETAAATFSTSILKGLLRDKMGFDGLVISDDLEMQAVTQATEEIPALAINAGIDLLLICHDISKVTQIQDALVMGIETGKIPITTIDRSFEKIFKVKQNLPDLEQEEINLNQVLKEIKKLAEEMSAYLT